MQNPIADRTVLGEGPTGLFAAFRAGMRGPSTRIVDSLPEPEGRRTALDPGTSVDPGGGFPERAASTGGREVRRGGTVEGVTGFDNRRRTHPAGVDAAGDVVDDEGQPRLRGSNPLAAGEPLPRRTRMRCRT